MIKVLTDKEIHKLIGGPGLTAAQPLARRVERAVVRQLQKDGWHSAVDCVLPELWTPVSQGQPPDGVPYEFEMCWRRVRPVKKGKR
jgi:hypothetical protein